MSAAETYTLPTAAARSGLSPHQVRIYLDMGMLSPCATTDGGFRLFDANCIRRLRLIKACRDADIGLAEISLFVRSVRPETPVSGRALSAAHGCAAIFDGVSHCK